MIFLEKKKKSHKRINAFYQLTVNIWRFKLVDTAYKNSATGNVMYKWMNAFSLYKINVLKSSSTCTAKKKTTD